MNPYLSILLGNIILIMITLIIIYITSENFKEGILEFIKALFFVVCFIFLFGSIFAGIILIVKGFIELGVF